MELTGEENWRLFFATGLPEAYLLARAREQEREREEHHAPRDESGRPAGDSLQGIR